MTKYGRKGLSTPLVIAVAIIVIFSGRFAWMKYQTITWTKKTKTNLQKSKKLILEALKSATYPVFSRKGQMIVAKSPSKGITFYSKKFETDDTVQASVHAAETPKDVASFFVCSPIGESMCKVIFHRLYMDSGKSYGAREEYVAALYLERREIELPASKLSSIDELIENVTDGEHKRLVRTAARVRFSVAKKQEHSGAPHITFEILCREASTSAAQLKTSATAETQVRISFKAPN